MGGSGTTPQWNSAQQSELPDVSLPSSPQLILTGFGHPFVTGNRALQFRASDSERPGSAARSPAAEQRVLWDRVLVPPRVRRRVHPEVELLAEVLPGPALRPHVPHPHVVQWHVDGGP